MIKSFFATTREIDDPQAAAAEITEALNLEKNSMKNSLGIITCFSEFDDTGALKAICDALPFDCIGATTNLCSAAGEIDQVLLAITVLTSDDCSFKAILLPINEDFDTSIGADLTTIMSQSDEKPAVILSYFPLINTVSGDMILAAIEKVTGDIPIFGTMAIDHNPDYSSAKTIYNGEAFREATVLGLIFGDVECTFEVASLDEGKIRKQKAIITESSGNVLISVNDKTAIDYLLEIGITKNDLETGLGILPLVIDNKDGTKPVARAVFALTPDGHAVCGGAMPVGATLALGRIIIDDVISTTEKALGPLAAEDGVILSYSCMARYLALGADGTVEAEKVREMIGGGQYLFAISSGEVCPLPNDKGKLINFFHNYTNVFCRLS